MLPVGPHQGIPLSVRPPTQGGALFEGTMRTGGRQVVTNDTRSKNGRRLARRMIANYLYFKHDFSYKVRHATDEDLVGLAQAFGYPEPDDLYSMGEAIRRDYPQYRKVSTMAWDDGVEEPEPIPSSPVTQGKLLG